MSYKPLKGKSCVLKTLQRQILRLTNPSKVTPVSYKLLKMRLIILTIIPYLDWEYVIHVKWLMKERFDLISHIRHYSLISSKYQYVHLPESTTSPREHHISQRASHLPESTKSHREHKSLREHHISQRAPHLPKSTISPREHHISQRAPHFSESTNLLESTTFPREHKSPKEHHISRYFSEETINLHQGIRRHRVFTFGHIIRYCSPNMV